MIALMLASFLLGASQSSSGAALNLNGDWRFQLALDASDVGRLERTFQKPEFDASTFAKIRVPANWAMEGFEEPQYGRMKNAGTGFYLHRFQAPAEWKDQRILLHFDGVWASAEVWLNGVNLGRHDSGFTSFAFEIQHTIKLGEINTLAVEVRQITRDYAYDVNDDWSLGGIFRDVWIECMPAARYIDHVDTWTTFDDQYRDADLHVRALVQQTRSAALIAAPYELRATLTSADGQVAGETRIPSAPHRDTGREHLFKLHVRAPKHWTAETPNLYSLRVELLEDGRVSQAREHRVGFRQISTSGGVLRLNGQSIKLRGACRHDQHPDVGIATRREHWLQDLRLMKQANINAIRMVHYPPAAGFLDLCDEMGMYVLDEVPMGYGGDLGVDPSFAGAAMLRTYETIARDRNHPSVIIWDVGNENAITALHMAALRYIKGNDPTRPVLLPWHAEEWLPPEVDILAPHYPTTAQAEAIVARAGRPVIATEYSHALGENGFGDHARRWEALSGPPSGAGGTIWMWQEQGLWQERHTASGTEKQMLLLLDGSDGIVTADRKPQRDLWEAKAVYAPVRVLVEKLDAGHQARTVAIPVRNDFDFTDLDQVTIRWKLMSGERKVKQGATRLKAAPHTTTSLPLPVECDPAQPCYAHIAFLRPDGGEITTTSVELTVVVPVVPPPARARLRRGKLVTLEVGGAAYEFDPSTGLLAAVSAGGRRLIEGARPTIWRALNVNEQSIYKRRLIDPAKFPDLDKHTIVLKSFLAKPEGIEAETEHRVDQHNKFMARWSYTPLADGSLKIAYTITPQIEAPWVPEAGLEIKTTVGLDRLRWLGLGPLDAFPNLKAATLFGIWRLNADQASGVKADVRWAELTNSNGNGLRLYGSPFVRLAAPGQLRALSAVEGRPSAKFQRAEKADERLDAGPGATFTGSVTLRLMP
jgi:beta-galactosidase